mmetsp:Transcript_20728/g.37112  ORF Transcript_20728/g.37112 Transcript_20728/m.37112 type:complete len:128 (-) Transcript_20728:70-453(-)
MVSSTNYVNKLYSFLNQNHELIRPIRIVFGSASPSRQEIIKELFGLVGLSYEVCTADIDEKQIRSEVPEELVTLLGHAKADAIIKKIEGLLRICILPATEFIWMNLYFMKYTHIYSHIYICTFKSKY